MSPRTATQQNWILASLALTDAYTDFILSRQAMQCTPATLDFHKQTPDVILAWIEHQGITSPDKMNARHVRQFLAELVGKGKAKKSQHVFIR